MSTGRGARAALAAGFALLVVGGFAGGEPASALTPGGTTFSVSATVHEAPVAGFPAADCGPASATLSPGVTRCLTFDVDNHLDSSIVVDTVTMSLDPAFPAPPTGCQEVDLALPELSSPLAVPAMGSASSRALPISLKDSPVNQDACQGIVLHFTFTATAASVPTAGVVPAGTGADSGSGSLAFTGSEVLPLVTGGALLVALGLILVLVARRRDRERVDSP